MAFNNKTYQKKGKLSEPEFIKHIAQINEAESVTGVKYYNIDLQNGIIFGIRESNNQPFSISAEALYKAYCELDVFNTSALKPYVNRVQSPAMAILISADLIIPVEKDSVVSHHKKITSTPKSSLTTSTGRQRKNGMNCTYCGNYISLTPNEDRLKNITCPMCSNTLQNPNYEEKRILGLKKSTFFFIFGVIVCVAIFAISNNYEAPYIENGELHPAAKVEAITMIKRQLKNPSSYSGHGWTQGDWDKNSDSERYFLLHYFTVTNKYGQKEDLTATVIFNKDGHVTRVVISP